jgi:hypothetical protein
MGYLNKETVTVDAILTKRGRQLLSQGQSAFQITKFAVADDEVDYGLYDPAHPLGTQYYGSAIENMPIVEATPDETQNLRFKLVTLSRDSGGINIIPTIGSSIEQINMTFDVTPTVDINLETSAGQNIKFDEADGYTAVLFDRTAVTIVPIGNIAGVSTAIDTDSISTTSLVVQGLRGFSIEAKDVDRITNTQLVITGNESGATITIPITVNPGS